MEKLTIDFETFNKIKEIANESVDNSLRKLFTVCDDKGNELPSIITKYVEDSSSFKLLLTNDLVGYKYRDLTNSDYKTNINKDFGYPLTLYLDTKNKLWWVDMHNINPNHPSYNKLVQEKLNDNIPLIKKTS